MSGRARSLQSLLRAGVLLALAASAPAEADRLKPHSLFAAPAITQVSVSPSGEWVVGVGLHGETWGVIVQHRDDGVKTPVYASRRAIRWVVWVAESTLYVRHDPHEPIKAAVLRFERSDSGVLCDRLEIRKYRDVVAPLTREGEVVLWAAREMKGGFAVFRGPVAGLAGGRRWEVSGELAPGEREVVAKLRERVWRWVADHRGVVRAALTIEGGRRPEWVLRYRSGQDERWRSLWRGDIAEDAINPLGVTRDGERLIVLARGDRDTRGVHELDPESQELVRALFVHPDVDVEDVIFDPEGSEIIGVVYDRGGDAQYYYLDAFRDRYFEDIEQLGLGENVMVTGSSRDHRYLTLLVQDARNPGTFYFYDKETGRLTRLGDRNLEVRPEWLAPTESFRVKSEDGTPFDAFLARPETEDGSLPPLVVFPHGGPIGVRDDRSFNPWVQYIATAGIAVLQVNYRGSGGYGKAFEAAGQREWGRGIEDDIDAAVQLVVDRGLVDPSRVCIAGGSYGGYSALMSAIRRPDRYRCIVTINGVTDVPLIFQSTDSAAYDAGRKRWIEIIGDPETDFDHLVDISPVYHVEELEAPVLIVHGTKDTRVDPDHAHRLRAMLELYGKPYEWLEIPGAGHGFDRTQDYRVVRALLGFVKFHLRERPPEVSGAHR